MLQPVMLDVQNWQINVNSNGWQAHSLCLSALSTTNYKHNGLKDNIGKSIADQVGKVR